MLCGSVDAIDHRVNPDTPSEHRSAKNAITHRGTIQQGEAGKIALVERQDITKQRFVSTSERRTQCHLAKLGSLLIEDPRPRSMCTFDAYGHPIIASDRDNPGAVITATRKTE